LHDRGATKMLPGCYGVLRSVAGRSGNSRDFNPENTKNAERERASRAKESPGAQRTLLNSLRLTWCLGVLVDAVALLRNLALLQGIISTPLLEQLRPKQGFLDLEP